MAKAAVHKQNLVHTAMRLFRRQGYAATGLQQILHESGAPRGSLYHYFPAGKESLGEAAIRLAGEKILQMLTELAERHREPRAFLRAYCKVMADWMEESEFRSGCPIATVLLETAPASPDIAEAGAQAFDSWGQVIADVLMRANLSRRSARAEAQLIIGAMEGALLLARVRQSTRPILDVARMAPDGD